MGHVRNENLMRLFGEVDQHIHARFDQWCEWRRHLHANPELSWEERETTSYIRNILEAMDLDFQPGPRDLGGVVNISTTDAVPRIALRGDIDAIPVTEETGLEFESRVKGVMHACGHDIHTTVVLAVCQTIHALQDKITTCCPLNFRAIFQPAEEVAQGATEMIENGAIEGVDRIMAMHVDSSRDVGAVGFRDGVQTARCDELHVRFTAEGGHGARPYETADPVFAAAQFVNLAYSAIPRRTDPREAVVMTFCHIAGGHSSNVIPSELSITGTLRSFDDAARQDVLQKLTIMAQSVQLSTGVEVQVEVGTGIPSVNNNAAVNDLMRGAAETFLPPEAIGIVEPSLGGEDFSCYQKLIPGAMVRVGSANGNYGRAHLHSPHFDVDEQVIKVAVGLFSRSILHWGQSVA